MAFNKGSEVQIPDTDLLTDNKKTYGGSLLSTNMIVGWKRGSVTVPATKCC